MIAASHPLRVSVVINTWNRLALLPRTLAALRLQRYPAFEVIVVDGPSSDGTGAWLAAHAADRCKLARVAHAHLCESRNAGLRLAAGEIVAYIDDDAVPEAGWLAELVAAFDDPAVVAAGGFVRDHTGVAFQARHIAFDRDGNATMDDAERAAAWSPGALWFRGFIGSNVAFRRAALVAIGGFDEEYRYHLDETDVLVRLLDAGGRPAVRPLAEVHHGYAPSNLRDARRTITPEGYHTILRSIAYYTVQARGPGHAPAAVRATVARRQADYRAEARTQHREGRTDGERHRACLRAIDEGAAEGLRDAAAHPQRRLPPAIGPAPAPFRPYPIPLAAAERLRLCVLLPDAAATAGPLGALAAALAAGGHEVSVLVPARDGHATVTWSDGLWLHHVPARRAALVPLPALAGLPPRAVAAATNLHAEVLRTELQRGYHGVLAGAADLGAAALAAAGRLPVALCLDALRVIRHASVRRAEAWLLPRAALVLAGTVATARAAEAAYGLALGERLRLVSWSSADGAAAAAALSVLVGAAPAP